MTDTDTTSATDQADRAHQATRAKALFAEVDALDAEVRTAEELLHAAEKKRSAKIGEIATEIGKGPFTRKGVVYTIASKGDAHVLRSETPKPKGLVVD